MPKTKGKAQSKPTRATARKIKLMSARAVTNRTSERLWGIARAAGVVPGDRVSQKGVKGTGARTVSATSLSTLASRVGAEMEAEQKLLENRYLECCPGTQKWKAKKPPLTLPTVSTAFAARLEYLLMIIAQVTAYRANKVSARMRLSAVPARVTRAAVNAAVASMTEALAEKPTLVFEHRKLSS